ncbi:MAG: hypothetical protein IKR09_05905 [Alphaproteobacteria bacterium]|nr:hypothetical protein [Alphaproteobacteria bacterium]
MKYTLEKLKKPFSKNNEKKYLLSGGTFLFLAFNLLLVCGFCKFSFYVLKNHRSAVERDSLIKTYVDVQPQSTKRHTVPAYFSLSEQNKEIPSPFFVKRSTEKAGLIHQVALNDNIPSPAFERTKSVSIPAVEKSPVRPPVIRPAVRETPDRPESEKQDDIISKESPSSPAVSLDDLMASGLELLNQSEKAVIIASEQFLNEDVLPEKTASSTKTETAQVATKPFQKVSDKKEEIKKKEQKETRWVDVAELRRQLNASKQEEIKRQNAAMLEMNGSKQVASLDTESFSDVQEHRRTPDQTRTVENDTKKETAKPAVTPPETEKEAEEEIKSSEKTTQVAVVQDIPFSEATPAPEQIQKTPPSPSSFKHKAALAGDSPDLWKIAAVKGTSKKNIGGNEEKTVQNKTGETVSPVAQTAFSNKQDIIYRNGKAVALQQERKSLNWLDRQEAAVWTSMSQSDTPSVWSAGTETDPSSSEKAKAFRVADEQPVPATSTQEISSAPVRVIGEEKKPETKENPILLPLGSSAPAAASAQPSGTTPSAPGQNPAQSFPNIAAGSTDTDKTAATPDDGLMTKIFSFFGKNETPEGVPSIGSDDSVKAKQDSTEKTQNDTSAGSFSAAPSLIVPKTKTETKSIDPTELRLTFKPDNTEMSVQSIKWIKALGQKAKKDIQNAVEVRMSNINPALQNKRFAIIRNTLLGVGMEEVQIIPVVTDRTPHTIVLRMITLPEEGYTEYTTESNGIKERLYYKQW